MQEFDDLSDLFTCVNCYWNEQCINKGQSVCEYFDCINELGEEVFITLCNNAIKKEFIQEWKEYIEAIKSDS